MHPRENQDDSPKLDSGGPTVRRILFMIVLVAMVSASTGCAGRLSGVVDYDRELDFSKVKTLAFYEDAYPLDRSQTEVRKLIRARIDQVLRDAGYGMGRAGEADLLIVYHVGNRAKVRLGGTLGTAAREASLAISFQDPVTRRSAWYGTVEQTWQGDEDVATRIDKAVAILLAEFPPPKGESMTPDGDVKIRE